MDPLPNQLTDEQVANWRRILCLSLGPYALIMPREEVQRWRDMMQDRVNDDEFGCPYGEETANMCTPSRRDNCAGYATCKKWEVERSAAKRAKLSEEERSKKWMREHFDVR